jgi:hypothetical protein
MFPPQFYAMVAAYWAVYSPIVLVWLMGVLGAALLIGVVLVAAMAFRSLFFR